MTEAKEASEPKAPESGSRLIRLLIPSLGDFLFVAVMALLFVARPGGWQGLLVDGDTGWHIRNGDWILRNHRVPRVDQFSFSKPGQPWYAWEWLSDVILAAAHAREGLKGVVVICGLAICLSLLILFRYLLWRGAGFGVALFMTVLVADSSQIHNLARPHVFTLVLFPVSLWILDAERRRPSAAVWLLVPIALVWVNLHGGFLVLFVSLGLWTVGEFLRDQWRGLRRPLVVSGACLLATLANPYGYRLYGHLAEYLRSDFITRYNIEFQPPQLRSEGMYKFEGLLFLGLALLFFLWRKRKYEDGLQVTFWGHEALQSARHVPIFLLAAAPVIGTEAGRAWGRYAAESPGGSVAGVVRDLNREFTTAARRSSIWVGIVALTLWWWPAGPGWPTDFSKEFPAAMVSRNLAILAPANGPPPRLLSSDSWGGYLIYRLSPKTPVFIDGRSDFYGPEIGSDYLCLMGGCGRWMEIVNKWGFDQALLPRDWVLGELLEHRMGWRVVNEDKTAVLLAKVPPVPAVRRLSTP